MSALAMFSLKCPSLLDFDKLTRQEKSNLRAIFDIQRVPCDTQMRMFLDKAPDTEVHTVLIDSAQRFMNTGGFRAYN